jgi:ribonuclease HII
MRIVGIDEAGYAPLLGPLVSSRVEFDSSDPKTVSEALLACPVKIADSKTLYHGEKTLHRLEQPVCVFYPGNGSLGSYLDAVAKSSEPPFYSDFSLKLPFCNSPSVNDRHLAERMKESVRFSSATSLYLSEHKFNTLYLKTNNKSEVLWQLLRTHIQSVVNETEDDVLFLVDRIGSRRYYAGHLWELFGKPPNTVRETKDSSEYGFIQRGRRILFRIETRADSTEPTVSLASIFSKYLRELFVFCLCRYFSARLGEQVSVSGYRDKRTKDFVRRIEKRLGEWRISKEQIIRMA